MESTQGMGSFILHAACLQWMHQYRAKKGPNYFKT